MAEGHHSVRYRHSSRLGRKAHEVITNRELDDDRAIRRLRHKPKDEHALDRDDQPVRESRAQHRTLVGAQRRHRKLDAPDRIGFPR